MTEFEFSRLGNAPVVEVSAGIRIRPLWEHTSGSRALVVELEPGACLQELEVHQIPELLYVMEGVFDDGTTQHPAGTFIYGPAGSSHIPQSDVGCRAFVVYAAGIDD